MQKIPTLFERDWNGDRSLVLDIPNPSADVQWVFDGEGVATRKWDGVCTMRDEDGWWTRREITPKKPSVPDVFKAISVDHATGSAIGWIPIEDSGFAKWHAQAFVPGGASAPVYHGTYELVGPRINGNPEQLGEHQLIPHAHTQEFPDAPRSFALLAVFFYSHDIEGLVWHHDDGRMAKIKRRDFGMKRFDAATRS